MEEKGKKASKMMNQEQIFKIMLSMTFIVSAVFFLKIFRRIGPATEVIKLSVASSTIVSFFILKI